MNIKKFNIMSPFICNKLFNVLELTPFCAKIVSLAAHISSYIILIKYFVYEGLGFFCLRVYKIHIRKRNFMMHINKFTCRKKMFLTLCVGIDLSLLLVYVLNVCIKLNVQSKQIMCHK